MATAAVDVGGSVRLGPTGVPSPGAPGGFVDPGAPGGGGAVGRGVGAGGARANGGSSPTIALGWMLRSWFLLPDASSWSVRMCHGAPDTWPAPSDGPPRDRSQ